MKYAVLDCETLTKNKGNPFTKGNKLCLVGILIDGKYEVFDIEYSASPYGPALARIKSLLESVDFLVGFNIKFDLHWIRNYVPTLDIRCVFDTQLGDFLLNHQRYPYPSLDDSLARFGLDPKLDIVKREYWDHGIDTDQVPRDLLEEYLRVDVERTNELFLKQRTVMTKPQRKLMKLQGEDLLLLMEMERNGLKFDTEKAKELGEQARRRISEIDGDLVAMVGVPFVNFNSSDHISSLLFGGTIYERFRHQYERELKDGSVVQRERWEERPHDFPRIVHPIKGTETEPTCSMDEDALRSINAERGQLGKKPHIRHWSVAEPILKRLKLTKKAKRIVDLLLERSTLEKLDSTYYTGLLEKMKEKDAVDGLIHGQFNQVVAVTSRLSSSNPNLQNFAGAIKELFVSRYV